MNLFEAHQQLAWPAPERIVTPSGGGMNHLASIARAKIESPLARSATPSSGSGNVSIRTGLLSANPESEKSEAPLAIVCEFNRHVSIKTLQETHRLAWNFSHAPILVTLEPGRILLWSCCVPPAETGGEDCPAQRTSDLASRLVSVDIKHTDDPLSASADIYGVEKDAIKALHWVNLLAGRHFAERPDAFKPAGRLDETLIQNLVLVRNHLSDALGLPKERCHDLLARLIFIQFLFQRTDSKGRAALHADRLRSLYKDGILRHSHSSLEGLLSDYEDSYRFFKWLNGRFNGDLFPGKSDTEKQRDKEWAEEKKEVKPDHLDYLSRFISGREDLQSGQGFLWRSYAFDVIPLELISSIYEMFVGPPEKDKAYYTPGRMVDFMLDAVLPWKGDRADLKVLDPSCGSGIFLVKTFQRLAHRLRTRLGGDLKPSDLRDLLSNQIFGVDINPEAVRVAAFSLYLSFCDELDPRHYWSRDKLFPPLRGINLLDRDFFADESPVHTKYDAGAFDLVIGNAPWGKSTALDPRSDAKGWAKNHGWTIPYRDHGPLFLAKAAHLAKPDGWVSMIQPGGLLLNRSEPTRKFRRKLLSSYSPVCRNEWVRGVCEKPRVKCSECPHQAFPPLDEAAARDHLTGKAVIGTYAIREDNSCVFLAADFDGAGWKEDIRAYRDAAREMGVEVAVERSRSGDGGHAWIFFGEPVPALLARRLGTLIVAKASALHPAMSLASYDRFFPNQDTLPAGGFGNLIALPLQAKAREGGNSVFLDDDFTPHPEQWIFLAGVPKLGRERLEELLEQALPAESGEMLPRFEDRVLDTIPAAVKKGDFIGTARALHHAQLEIPTGGLPASLIAALKRLATLANPVFFEKQRLRFGTYNIPRFIFCGEMQPDRLILPRGVAGAAVELFRKAGGRLEIEDQWPTRPECDFTFHGELTPDQQSAVDAMLAHDDGVLLAPPGAGKTVMGCAIIAARKTPTLILVHRRPLLEQWRSRLETFLGLEKKEIAVLTAGGVPEHATVAIGMIQTFAKSPHPGALFAPFGQVIIDECHHVPAASFEAVMKTCTARHFLGLTATPNRKDGLQKILFLQCGPIRHRMEPEPDPNIERVFLVRDIHLGLPPEDSRMPVHQLWELLANHKERNRIIATDITEALHCGRRCVVLSDRKEHLVTLEKLVGEMASAYASRIHRIDGAMGKKVRAAVLSEIANHAETGGGFALFATSSLVGEGFDLPELDTLFLTLPVSFKGRIIQYAGRLHRECEGKSDVRIYDYVESEHPLTSHMHRKRLAAYRGMGYRTADVDGSLPRDVCQQA